MFIKFASEAGRYYLRDGTPFLSITAKTTGKQRPVNIRDVREASALPSVTTILKVAAKPGLDQWIQQQFALEAYTMPVIAGETAEQWMTRVKDGARAQAAQAADRGTYIHGGIECAMRGEPFPLDIASIVQAAIGELGAFCGDQLWQPERSFGHHEGWAGKVDLHSPGWVVDFKTKANVGTTEKLYDEHTMQLAAYRHGLGIPAARCAIVFVDREQPVARFVEVGAEELTAGLEMFRSLHRYWCLKHKYWPQAMRDAA